ncbi:MAG: hypothetical protein Q9181_006964 [Wetmoreana brouardii]
MLTILYLPNELIDHISRLLSPPDLEAFARSSKPIYTALQHALKRHAQYKKKYALIKFGHRWFNPSVRAPVSDYCRHALLLLASILENPDIAHYPTTTKISFCADEDDCLDCLAQSVIENYSDELRHMIDECDHITTSLIASMSVSIRHPQNENAAACLAVNLLPNLRSLTLDCFEADTLHNIVRSIALANGNPKSPNHQRALPQLRDFSLSCMDDDEAIAMKFYGSFAMLPSIRSLHGYGIDGETFNWPSGFKPPSSRVTDISIYFSSISASSFEHLLSGIANLQTFTYRDAGPIINGGPYQPVGIIDALRKYASHGLKTLDIGSDAVGIDVVRGDGKAVGSLRMFTCLKSIRLEDAIFLHDTSEGLRSLEPISKGSRHVAGDGYVCDEGPLTELLVDVLPASVKEFVLVQLLDAEHTKVLLKGLAALKAYKTPRLAKLMFECPDPLDHGMKKDLRRAGIELWSTRVAK